MGSKLPLAAVRMNFGSWHESDAPNPRRVGLQSAALPLIRAKGQFTAAFQSRFRAAGNAYK
jgi:hypothetical protein